MKWVPLFLLLFYGLSGCVSLEPGLKKTDVYRSAFSGLMVMDPETGRVLCNVNGDKAFIPASTVKILTLYACLHTLGDSTTGFLYNDSDGKLLLRGTGDPTFLNSCFNAWQHGYNWIKNRPDSLVQLRSLPMKASRFGPGWAWDDHNEGYQTERSALPVYGMLLHIRVDSLRGLYFEPPVVPRYIPTYNRYDSTLSRFKRMELHPLLRYPNPTALKPGFHQAIPLLNNLPRLEELLADTLGKRFQNDRNTDPVRNPVYKRLSLCPVDTVYRRMMYQSDNFIAEQLLLSASGLRYDTLDDKRFLQWAKDSLLAGLPSFRWVDGSGLSRYNLVSPNVLAQVLCRLWREQPHERLMALFPPGGAPGTTLEGLYKLPGRGASYIHAKSGSMTGVQCLSGYMTAKSGRVLVFSIMNNQFLNDGKAVKHEMEDVLEEVWRKW